MKGMSIVVVLVLVSMMVVLAGCQTDVVGPSVSFKALYKGENNNKEYLSRNSGMASQTGYKWALGNFGTEDK